MSGITVSITNVQCALNLTVDPSNLNVITLRRCDDTDKYQQWIQFVKADNAICFKNVGSGSFLCADNNPSNPDGVIAEVTRQFQWFLQQVEKQNNVIHWRIRPFSRSNSVDSKNIQLNDNKNMWEITPIS